MFRVKLIWFAIRIRFASGSLQLTQLGNNPSPLMRTPYTLNYATVHYTTADEEEEKDHRPRRRAQILVLRYHDTDGTSRANEYVRLSMFVEFLLHILKTTSSSRLWRPLASTALHHDHYKTHCIQKSGAPIDTYHHRTSQPTVDDGHRSYNLPPWLQPSRAMPCLRVTNLHP